MDKKQRGAVDPFTLGLVITLLGSVFATVFDSDSKTSAQGLEPLSAQEQIVMTVD